MRSHSAPTDIPADDRLRQLRRATRAFAFATSQQDIIDGVVRHTAALLRTARVVLLLSDEEGTLRIRAARGMEPGLVDRVRNSLDSGLVRRLRNILAEHRGEEFLGVPLVATGRVIGVLAALGPRVPAGRDAETLLSMLADQAAVALEKSRLEQRLHRLRTADGGADGEAERARRRALESLGHDLRSPLQAIQTCVNLLSSEMVGPLSERQFHVLERIDLSGRHILALVDKTVEMARLSAGAVEIECRPLPTAAVIEEAASIIAARARQKGQRLETRVDAGLRVLADPDRLRQALVNLLSNAVKYTPSGGHVRITARPGTGRETDRVLIRVSDDGPGIRDVHRDAIFEPYFRANGEQTGSGLGLPIAREVIRRMEGDITLEDSPGRGATFVVHLPATDDGPS